MTTPRITAIAALLAVQTSALLAATPPRILTNQVGYDLFAPKTALIQTDGSNGFSACTVASYPDGTTMLRVAPTAATPVADWRDWQFRTVDFSALQQPGRYTIACTAGGASVQSAPFELAANALERATIPSVLAYFKAERVSGEFAQADRHLRFEDSKRPPIDARGGWYDATGDYGVHLSQLDFTSYFNTQQVPLVVVSLGRTMELLAARHDANFNQLQRRLADELAWGADFLVRMQRPGRSFYETIDAPGPGKRAADRRIGRAMTSFGLKRKPSDSQPERHDGAYEVSFRSGGGFAIAGLALAARLAVGGDFSRADYLAHAESAFAFLHKHNRALTNDGVENIVDDYSALFAASELLRTTGKPLYAQAARQRADSLLARLASDGKQHDYWRADDKDRPFFNPADAGAPVVSLLDYYPLADAAMQARIQAGVRRSLEHELSITDAVANPFGLARQYVQGKRRGRYAAFFFPHDTETGAWWQGENARLASLAAAARLAEPLFADDPAFRAELARYASDQLDWILGKNPFDVSMMQGVGRNNPLYGFFGSWQYTQTPGGIVNGITSGWQDDKGIDFNLPYATTHQDADWRWGEQWLPHAAWYLLAVAARPAPDLAAPKAVIGYLYTGGQPLDLARIPARELTVLNYAFANLKDGRVVAGFPGDAANYAALHTLKASHPALRVLVSIGGWTWSGGFSDAALTPASRQVFIDSAMAFVQQHHLDGIDIDWEYPGQVGNGNPHRPQDQQDYTALLTGLRAALDTLGKADGKHYLLTIATGANAQWLAHTEMAKVARVVDYVNLMAYDQYGDGDAVTGHNAPLYTSPANPKQLSAAAVVQMYLAAGVPAAKLVLGVPFYGQAWAKVGATDHGLHQRGQFDPDIDTRYGALAARVGQNGYTRYWDQAAAAPYLYNAARGLFISYDDPASLRLKSQYVTDRGLGGVMFWELSGDPQHTLLEAIRQSLPH